jgi:hypothetical protein
MADDKAFKIVDPPKVLSSYSVGADGKVSVEQAQSLARKLSVVSAKMRIQRARAEFAEAKAVMLAAQQEAEQAQANLKALMKAAPGYKPTCSGFDDAGELVCPEVKK